MFHSNVHSQPYTLASLVSSAWQLASDTAMSLIHNVQPHEDAVVSFKDGNAGEKVFPSSAPVHIRKNRQKKDVGDLQESAPNSTSPPRAIPVLSDAASPESPVEVVCETGDTSDMKKRRRGGRRRNVKKSEADQAETVSAGVVEGSSNDVDNGEHAQNQEKKEGKRRRNNKNRKEQKDTLGDGDIQGDISEQPSSEDKVEQKPKQPRQRQRNAKKAQTEKNDESVKPQESQTVEAGIIESTPETERVSESPESPKEEVPTPTKGNRRRQRQRENKKKGKLQQQEQVQGDVEEQTGEAEEKAAVISVPTPTSSPSQSPPPSNKLEQQPKQTKTQKNKKSRQTKENKEPQKPPSPKDEEHGHYKNSVLKHLFLKQHGTDSQIDACTVHEVAIKPIRQPKGPTAIGERGFSAEYRNSRTVKV